MATVADVDRWNPQVLDRVFEVAKNSGNSLQRLGDGLGEVERQLSDWRGQTADAYHQNQGKILATIDDQRRQTQVVRDIASRAKNDVKNIKEQLAAFRAQTDRLRLRISPDGTVQDPYARQFTGDEAKMRARVKIAIERDLKQLLARATVIDSEIAAALDAAVPTAHPVMSNSIAKVPNIPIDPLPRNPRKVKKRWDTLTPDQKRQLFNQNYFVGNSPGIPFEDKDGLGRDYFNRQHLSQLMAVAQGDVDNLRNQHPEWAENAIPHKKTAEWKQWNSQWENAKRKLDNYQKVQDTLNAKDGLTRYLGTLDAQGRAAISINNPDNAKRVATFVPGTGIDLMWVGYIDDQSAKMLGATMLADRSLNPGDVSVTTWMGYDRPMTLPQAAHTHFAKEGAQSLDDFQEGLRASHNDALTGGPAINTVIGHSYGSTLAGAAAINGHHLDTNNFVAVGSPGILAENASSLNLNPDGRFFASRAKNDVIRLVTGLTLGSDPTAPKFGGTTFEALPGPSWYGLPTVEAHSSYWSDGNPALASMGKIIAGRTDV